MASLSPSKGLLNDAVAAANLAFKSTSKDLFRTWILVPFGIVVMLYFVLALNTLIGLGSVDFPASVACLLILFFFLLGANFVLPEKKMDIVLRVLDVPIGFALRTMNLYFTPSFILLPLSKSISGKEVGVLIGVFVVGYVVQYALTAYTCRAIQLSLGKIRKSQNQIPNDVENHEITESGERGTEAVRLQTNDPEKINELPPPTTSDGAGHENSSNSWNTSHSSATPTPSPTLLGSNSFICENASPATTRPEKWAASIIKHLDIGIYACLFIFIGIPVYYATGYTMPIFLTLNVLIFFAANMIPPNIKRIAHPVLVTALFTVLGIWILALTESKTLDNGLGLYETGTKYLEYFRGSKNLPLPGAGDILASLLDASIVALAMPMYQYRKDLQKFFVAIFIPALVLALPSLFGYPPLCFAFGVSSTISLAMAPRSVTLALAQLSTSNLGGANSAISPIAVVSGISGPIFGPTILHFLRISEEDYVTTGVVLGANSSAIATAMLLKKDRRAAALSALSMSIFGLLFVILTAIPEVVTYVRNLVGL